MPTPERASLADRFVPQFDVSDTVACTVAANPEATWQALMDVDLMDVGRQKWLAGALGAVRMLPELFTDLLHGERPPALPERLRLKDTVGMKEGGWVLLEEQPRQLALGLVGKFWRPVISYATVPAEQFRDFAEPGWAKTVYSLAAEGIDVEHTLLTGTMRTATTDEYARRWFRRYWTLGVGPGAHVLVNGLLEVARDAAETGTRPDDLRR